jgi:Rrf2 family protein
MRLTRAGEYAVRAVLYLSSKEAHQVVGRLEIAREMEIPAPFLAKIAQQLARAGIVEIVQGSRGGLKLRVSPREVNLLNVVEAVEGEIFLNDCIMDPLSCRRSPFCSVYRVWNKARNQLRQCLAEASFSSLLAEGLCEVPPNVKQRDGTDGLAKGNHGSILL